MKEYELTYNAQLGVEYKRWVRVKARVTYCGVDLFLYRVIPGFWNITHLQTGKTVAQGKISPYPGGMVTFLDKVLTDSQRDTLRIISGQRLYLASCYKHLCGLPTLREARPKIQEEKERLWKLERTIIGEDSPF